MSLSPAPLVGATITITQSGNIIGTLTTDGNGQASTTLPVGTYTVTVTATGFSQLQFTLNVANSEPVQFQFEVLPKRAVFPVANEVMNEAGLATNNPPIYPTEAMSEASIVSEGAIADETMTETLAVSASPASWQINILMVFDTSTYQGGNVAPSGMQTVSNGNSEIITAATEKYSLYQYAILDGQTVLSNQVNFELVGTPHNLTVPAQASGTVHQATFFFKASWEIAVSGSTADGTYEVLAGNSISFSSNPGSAPCCAYNPNPPYQCIRWATQTWYLDGAVIGTGSSVTVPTQTTGTSHNLTWQWVC